MALSFLICIILPFVIPSHFYMDGMGNYKYGWPFSFVTIYQHEPTSKWFGHNFFTGNAGMAIDALYFILNLLIIYLAINLAGNIFIKIKGSRPLTSEMNKNSEDHR